MKRHNIKNLTALPVRFSSKALNDENLKDTFKKLSFETGLDFGKNFIVMSHTWEESNDKPISKNWVELKQDSKYLQLPVNPALLEIVLPNPN